MVGVSQWLLGEWSRIGRRDVGFRLGLKIGSRRGKTPKRKVLAFYDALEDRALMATVGYDYILSGFKWANPSRITYSFPPDGVMWEAGKNVLNTTFDTKFGNAWQGEIARALATWQSVANINIVPASDGRYDWNSLGQSQGDSKFGDIRIGGYPFGGNKKTLAQAYFPPPQGATAGGDVQINTSMSFQINGQYDLFSVVLHETGHSLGLNHSENAATVMAATYGGVRSGLTDGDIAGIQAIYGARKLDVYQSQGLGLSANLPIDLTSGLVSTNTATAGGASLTKIGDVEWFSFVAPSYASGSWNVTAGAANVSMLSPEVSVYDASMNLLARAGDPSSWSSDATAAVSSIVPGQRYYVSVKGATSDVFSVGAYNLTISLPKGSPSTPRPTPTPTPNPTPNPWPTTPPVIVSPTAPVVNSNAVNALPDRFESNDVIGAATRIGRSNQFSVTGLSLHSATDVDYFMFQNATAGTFQIVASGAAIQVLNPRGGLVAQGVGSVNASVPRNATVYVRVVSANSAPLSQYGLSIALQSQARQTPLPRTPLPRTPLPRTPLPRTPLPRTPLPRTPLPRTPLPPWFALPRFALHRYALRLVAPSTNPPRPAHQEIAAAPLPEAHWIPRAWNTRMRLVATG